MCILIISILYFTCNGLADNPLILDQFTADPSAHVFDGKIYVYPSHDIIAVPGKGRPGWFCMEDYRTYSSENLLDWKDHGVIVTQNKVPWVKADSYCMWAPDCAFKNEKYYFYFPSMSKLDKWGIGVAVSDSPNGPFNPELKPIDGVSEKIDPCVFVDKDGKAYLYYSRGVIFAVPLKDNMLEIDAEPQLIRLPKKGHIEGPFVFERNGIYYMTYPHVANNTERIEYAVSESPMGPFEWKGIIMDESPTGCWTNHHSIAEYKSKWYLFYHHNDLSLDFDKNRSIRADYLYFNDDGTIQKVIPTLRGVGVANAGRKIQIDRYSSKSSGGVDIDFVDIDNKNKGWKTVLSGQDVWVQYNKVNFSEQNPSLVRVKVASLSGGNIEVRLDSVKGPLVAKVDIPKKTKWGAISAQLLEKPTGVHDLIVLLKDSVNVEIDWVTFK